jgi:hypothetical protein
VWFIFFVSDEFGFCFLLRVFGRIWWWLAGFGGGGDGVFVVNMCFYIKGGGIFVF